MKLTSKIFVALTAVLSLAFVSCNSKSTPVEQEYWKVDNNFTAPSSWKTQEYANSFSVQIPPYMRVSDWYRDESEDLKADTQLVPGEWKEITFNANREDGVHDSYAYLDIKYIKGNDGDFNYALDFLPTSDQTVSTFCDMLMKKQLGTGHLLEVLRKGTVFTNGGSALDICYKRDGHTDGEGPVTVHTFFIQNYNEAVQITVSYHEKNKDAYKDLFNVITTFKWNHVNLKASV